MTKPLITVTGLAWAPPGSDTPIFSGVDFEVAAGERVTLEGPSGSGKSTLLRCIVGLEPRLDGEVLWRGEPVGGQPGGQPSGQPGGQPSGQPSGKPGGQPSGQSSGKSSGQSMRRFRNRVVYLHQRPSQVAEKVGENLAFAREMAGEFATEEEPAMSEDEQRQMCDRLGLEGVGFSRRFDDLSVGEQQRVCLVRTLTSRPDLLLLDEPTSALDPERVEQIEDLLCSYVDEAPDERAFLWVSHQPEQIERLSTRTIDLGQWTTGQQATATASEGSA